MPAVSGVGHLCCHGTCLIGPEQHGSSDYIRLLHDWQTSRFDIFKLTFPLRIGKIPTQRTPCRQTAVPTCPNPTSLFFSLSLGSRWLGADIGPRTDNEMFLLKVHLEQGAVAGMNRPTMSTNGINGRERILCPVGSGH